jgi:hypothetical protein
MGARLPEEERSMINGMVRQRGEELLDPTSCNVPKLGQLLALSATSLAKSVVFQYATVLHNPWILGLFPNISPHQLLGLPAAKPREPWRTARKRLDQRDIFYTKTMDFMPDTMGKSRFSRKNPSIISRKGDDL